jgi:hypothetical protein
MLAPIPVNTLPASRTENPAARQETLEPTPKIINPVSNPDLRPNLSDNGPHTRTDSPAVHEYPVNKKPIWDDWPNWARMAVNSGLMIMLSATPMKMTKKRHAITLNSSLGRIVIESYSKCFI